jgi:predicted DNA-binding protein with PD1-like motif
LTLRLANQSESVSLDHKYEIVSLVGTFAESSGAHLHLSVSDSTGNTIGGHLMDGNLIYTTAELVLGEAMDVQFKRELDPITTYKELKVEKR